MEINVFPHVSGAISMKRYFTGLIAALHQKLTLNIYSPAVGLSNIGFREKYLRYLKIAGTVKQGYNLVLSERFSFLLLRLQHYRTLVVCHDMVTLLNPRTPWLYKQWYKGLLWYMGRARLIICISESTRRDLLHFCPFISDKKVKVVYNGIEQFWFDDLPAQPDRSNIGKVDGKKFFLIVGRDAWNKNFDTVISALQMFQKPDFWVVKIGEISAASLEKLKQTGFHKHVINMNHVSDIELKWLYKNAEALIFPSLHEGFGWPALEAMACGCPVIASDTSSIPEVCGDAAFYINPLDDQAIVQAMKLVISDSNKRSEMKRKGLIQAAKFSWEETTRSFIRLLNNL